MNDSKKLLYGMDEEQLRLYTKLLLIGGEEIIHGSHAMDETIPGFIEISFYLKSDTGRKERVAIMINTSRNIRKTFRKYNFSIKDHHADTRTATEDIEIINKVIREHLVGRQRWTG